MINNDHYIDLIVASVPNHRKLEYLEFCQVSSKFMKKFGAVQCFDFWGDDIPAGQLTSLPLAVKANADETIVSSLIIWPSKEARNKGMELCEQDPEFNQLDMIFDGKKVIFGGFQVLYHS